ncbi:hypothetical protein [Bordetella avium]|uniref:Uncharacterized protein n=1 Tax=Bordetella avium (strain 197N) TaxID=360910 RepID=Q2KUE6_BORA1|nr:hypothetical protein [Bordetella avium]CAJ50714.1 hypothetical protein BAV3104 [Bordetella avium 197N]
MMSSKTCLHSVAGVSEIDVFSLFFCCNFTSNKAGFRMASEHFDGKSVPPAERGGSPMRRHADSENTFPLME